MMQRIEEGGAALADAVVRKRIDQIAVRFREELSGVRVEQATNQVAITGKRLLRRWLSDPILRFAGSLGQ